MSLSYFQRVDTVSPGSATFTTSGARAVEKYVTDGPVTIGNVQDAMRELVGDVDYGEGKLARTLPKCHPFYPWLHVSNVEVKMFGHTDSEGNIGQLVEADPELLIPPITQEVWQYVRAELTVTFEQRPYDLWPDEEIEPACLQYFLTTDTTTATGQMANSKEYQRFTDTEIRSSPQLASFQLGQLKFRTGSGAEPGWNNGSPTTFPGTPFVLMPDGEFIITWFHVPYSLFEDTTHPMWTSVAHVNQFPFFGHAAGKLLYMGPTARRYSPTFPFYQVGFESAFSAEKVCDISFRFLFTSRDATDPPNLSTVRGSWIATGHNAQPYNRDRKFYTVTSTDKNEPNNNTPHTAWIPMYPSFPMQLLFHCGGECGEYSLEGSGEYELDGGGG